MVAKKSKTTLGRAELKLESQQTQSIALGSAYATMKAISGEKTMANKWMQHIEACVKSGGKDCNAVKGIAAVYKKEIVGECNR